MNEEKNSSVPITEETIYTPTYNKLQNHYFHELFLSVTENFNHYNSSSSSQTPLNKIFFIFENSHNQNHQEKKEERKKNVNDEEISNLIYFRSGKNEKMNKNAKERLVGQIQAFLIECQKYEPKNENVEIINFLNSKFGLCHIEENNFVFVIGYDKMIPNNVIKKQSEKVHEFVLLYNGWEMMKEKYVNTYKEMYEQIGKEIYEFVKSIHCNYMSIFNPIEFFQLPYKNNSVFIKATRILSNVEENDLIGGAILYDNQIICNSINESLLFWLIYKVKNMKVFTSSLPITSVEEENTFFAKYFGNAPFQMMKRQVVESEVNKPWIKSSSRTNNEKKKSMETNVIKRLFKSVLPRIHGQIIFDENNINDVSLIYVSKDILQESRKERMVQVRKLDKNISKRFPKFIQNRDDGEYVLSVIEKYDEISFIRLYEMSKFSRVIDDQDQFKTRRDLIDLKKQVEKVISDNLDEKNYKFLQKNEIRYLRNVSTKKENEKILIFNSLNRTLTANFTYSPEDYNNEEDYYLTHFCKIHESFNDTNGNGPEISKIILKNPTDLIYAKKFFNNEVFYFRKRSKNDKTEITELEKQVKEKVRKEFKINLL